MPKRDYADPLYTEALDNALKNIYRVYGSDLSAFFRDARDEKDEVLTHANERAAQLRATPKQRRAKTSR